MKAHASLPSLTERERGASGRSAAPALIVARRCASGTLRLPANRPRFSLSGRSSAPSLPAHSMGMVCASQSCVFDTRRAGRFVLYRKAAEMLFLRERLPIFLSARPSLAMQAESLPPSLHSADLAAALGRPACAFNMRGFPFAALCRRNAAFFSESTCTF